MSALSTIAELLLKQLGDKSPVAGLDSLLPALQNLLPINDGELDLPALIEQFTSNGSLMALATSWLGDGANSPISGSQLASVLGEGKISQFAEQIGVDTSAATDALSSVIPAFIDGNSEGGNIMENPASMLSGALKSFF